MKLCSFTTAGRASYGLVVDGGIVDLGARFPETPTLRDFLAAGGLARRRAPSPQRAPDVALDAVTFDPVITNPDKIICVGLNYHDHVVETGRTVTANPVLFARYAGSQIGHGQPLVKPLESDEFDYEGELAVVIGKGGRRIREADALAHVGGLCLLQRRLGARLAAPHQPVHARQDLRRHRRLRPVAGDHGRDSGSVGAHAHDAAERPGGAADAA